MTTATERVQRALSAVGVAAEIAEFPGGTRTAQDAARAIGTTLGQIVKSLVFVADGRPLLVLVSGSNRVDLAKLARVAGATSVDRAGADAVREATGFAIGGVPPIGHAMSLDVFVDQDLLRYEVVYASAGTATTIFPIGPGDLVRISGGRTADLGTPL